MSSTSTATSKDGEKRLISQQLGMVRRDSSASRRYGEERSPSNRRDGREAHQPAGGTVLREPSVRSRDGEEKLVSHQEGW